MQLGIAISPTELVSNSTGHPVQPRNHPFRFLLYLEWGLVAIAIFSELLPTPLQRMPRFPLLAMVSIAGFGLMGLRLPTGRLMPKIAYTILEFGLILLSTAVGIRGVRLFPFMYIVLVIRSCLMFKLPGRLTVTGAAFTMFLVMVFKRVQDLGLRGPAVVQERIRPLVLGFALNSALLFGLALLFVLLLVNALLSERQSRERLAIANDQLRQSALRVENLAMLQERNRIARDIHDSLGHSLTALNIQLEGSLKLWQSNPPQAQTFLREAKRLGSKALQEVRQSVATMRSDPLQGLSLAGAIALLAKDFQQTTGVLPECHIQLAVPLSAEFSVTLYRIVQEALTNACKYAAATKVTICLQNTSTHLQLTVQDNGSGFQLDQNRTGFGLQGMRERTLALGGEFNLASAPGQGCCITACFSMPHSTLSIVI